MALGKRQKIALEWLRDEAWMTVWWGGRPHTGWPKELSRATYDVLRTKRFIQSMRGHRFEVIVSITLAGLDALHDLKEAS